MNKRGQVKAMKAVPLSNRKGIEFDQDTLQVNAQKVSVPAGQSAKSAMIDGPFGGKVKA